MGNTVCYPQWNVRRELKVQKIYIYCLSHAGLITLQILVSLQIHTVWLKNRKAQIFSLKLWSWKDSSFPGIKLTENDHASQYSREQLRIFCVGCLPLFYGYDPICNHTWFHCWITHHFIGVTPCHWFKACRRIVNRTRQDIDQHEAIEYRLSDSLTPNVTKGRGQQHSISNIT